MKAVGPPATNFQMLLNMEAGKGRVISMPWDLDGVYWLAPHDVWKGVEGHDTRKAIGGDHGRL